MSTGADRELLAQLPSMTELLKTAQVSGWLKEHPQGLVTACLRQAVAEIRELIIEGRKKGCTAGRVSIEMVLGRAGELLRRRVAPRVRGAINATGIILHTGLGRAVFPERVVDSVVEELKGYCTLAVDRDTGERIERDELIEELLVELTGAEAGTVVNNNAAATFLVLAATAAGREVIVSRGQLIEIGGSFRLPEVMLQSGAKLVEVGATNRTHLTDYARAITSNTAAIMRVHPSNYRIVGFTCEPSLKELAELAHAHNVLLIDDLGAGALVPLERFGMPHEPTMNESIAAGADLVLSSGDKLIGAAQSGIIIGRKKIIETIRKHPLMRAVRVDKTCLMVLERTLKLFRNPDQLPSSHPTYRMLTTPRETLERRSQRLVHLLEPVGRRITCCIEDGVAYLGSGSLPTEKIPSVVVKLRMDGMKSSGLARRLRLDDACIFARIEDEFVCLDMRTVTDAEVDVIAGAIRRIAEETDPCNADAVSR